MRTNPVFSPSQTKDFIRDPAAWYMVHVEGWVPRYIGKPDVARIAGIGFADGVAVWNNWLKSHGQKWDGDPQPVKSAAQVAHDSVKEEKDKVLALGQVVYEDQTEDWTNLENLVAKSVFKYADHAAATIPFPIRDVELALGPDHGFCRLDLVLEGPFGPIVVDYKHKLTLDARYETKTLNEYHYDWQMMHYAWAYGDHTGTQVPQTAIVLFVAEPRARAPKYDPVVIFPEQVQRWERDARQVWRIMEAVKTGESVTIEPHPWSTWSFTGRFGREKWADMFTKCRLEPSLLEQDYIRRKR